MLRRIFVEKKKGFDVEAQSIRYDLKHNLLITGITDVRVINRYDCEGLSDEEYAKAKTTVFSEPPVDNCYDETIEIPANDKVFAMGLLDGQFDQRADSCMQCIEILTSGNRPEVKVAKLIVISGDVSDDEMIKIKKYLINPVESCEVSLEKPEDLSVNLEIPQEVATVEGFIDFSDDEMKKFFTETGFAMGLDDLELCRDYFKNTEKRNPTITELKMIDTYWSDHCRHTTFSTRLENVEFSEGAEFIEKTYGDYIAVRKKLNRTKDICLMDIATIAVKELKSRGLLKNIDESEEINACSIRIDVDIDGKVEPWLLMFKNETHNHPTEIEPFGGAATCLGGAIRDPLSGRSYVYSAMRVTGSGDVRQKVADTLPNKLPQRKISQGAAAGYSSYGNQIGLATGKVHEIYHPGYVAKRMEIGAVVGAAPCENVRRERPAKGDVVVLLGGRTGRDGIGGATGSSKSHTDTSLRSCGAEVQKGNPPVERKLQRLFRNKDVTTLIKRCNDFGAGGVSVAIGELADGLIINLDKVPKKYEGLDGTEIAISESQERMACVVAAADADKFIKYANEENLEATVVAEVTDDMRLKMHWNGATIVDISREFLNTNGASKSIDVVVEAPKGEKYFTPSARKGVEGIKEVLTDLNGAGQKGLVERFDSTIGAYTVLMPFGGERQLTEPDAMVSKLPVLKGETTTCSVMSYGYDPYLSDWSPYHGAVYAVIDSVSKIVSTGGDYKTAYLTFQEYFERLDTDSKKWGKPLSALLGAFTAQEKLGLGSIGGKDSMSGTFNDISVPPTLVSFAITPAKTDDIISPEFKKVAGDVVFVDFAKDENGLPDFDNLKNVYDAVAKLIADKKAIAAKVCGRFGAAEAVANMCFGNAVGVEFTDEAGIYDSANGAFVLQMAEGACLCDLKDLNYKVIGKTTPDKAVIKFADGEITIDDAIELWSGVLEKVFPTKVEQESKPIETVSSTGFTRAIYSKEKFAAPRVFIPVFPGTNCEYDTARAFEKAGAIADVFVVNNLSSTHIAESLAEMARRIDNSQIVMIPGGFSGGDEPDGSGKFIASAFKNEAVKDAVHNLLKNRDGLMLGICNGFQALIKLGLVPYGEICDIEPDFPTLTFNTINRHVSCIVNTRIASNKSPWLSEVEVGDIHAIAVSHGEGRFVADDAMVKRLIENGQIATQYVDLSGNASMDISVNPNGSVLAIEGITSPDGRVLGKMGHSERYGNSLYKNIPGNKDQKLFESGVKYFK